MEAGTLRYQATLQRPVTTRGTDYIDPQVQWVDVALVAIAIEPLGASEFVANREVQGELSQRVRMRYRPGVSGTMRFVVGVTPPLRVLNIQGPPIADARATELSMTCTETASGS